MSPFTIALLIMRNLSNAARGVASSTAQPQPASPTNIWKTLAGLFQTRSSKPLVQPPVPEVNPEPPDLTHLTRLTL